MTYPHLHRLAAACLALFAGGLAVAHAATLPDSIAKSGTLTVAIVPNYPPLEFRDPATNTLTGFDVELGEAIARKLGVKLAWQETSFDQMMPAIATGRADAVISGMSDLATRHDAASFVDYLRTGPQFFIQQSRASEFKDMASLCGKNVGASRRTSFPKEIGEWSDAHCAGKPINVVGTEGSADARTQLRQGRIDAAVQGSETMGYIMEQEPNTYATLGAPFGTQLTGIAVATKETGLQQAIAGALDALIADGTYKTLLVKWHLADAGIEKATINAGQ
jgi:polar amino acid transport system substrate-binding protein